jgi:phage terminase large subunit-like protein
MKDPAHKYAQQVTAGKIVAGKYCRLACERYLNDLNTAEANGWEFRPSTARAYIEFFKKALVHTVGQYDGQPFEPLPWQQFILWNLYGWYNKDGSRRFRYGYVSVARKNGKTTLIAGCALAAAVFDEEQAGEVYFAATKRDQARIGFNEAARMATRSAALRGVCQVGKHDVYVPRFNSRITYLSSDSRSLDGLNASFCAIDEYAFHKDDAVSNVLRSSMQARRNPLHLTITTAGTFQGACYQLQRTVKQILDGVKEDPAQFGIIYELDEGDNWATQRNWAKANPSLGETVTLDSLKKQYVQAKNIGGSYQTEFKIKHLNTWVSASKTWIPAEAWAANEDTTTDVSGLPCWGGLDLASVSDLTALVLLYQDDETYHVRGYYWLPKETYEAVLLSDPAHPYGRFAHLPNFILTDGNVTDYASIRKVVTGITYTPTGPVHSGQGLLDTYDVKKIAYDRYNSTQIAIDLTNDGAPLAPYGQGFVSMSAPTKQLEVLVRSGKLKHDGCPVLAWSLQNVELRTDPAGNVKPDKGKSSGTSQRQNKIDPVVGLIMALGENMKQDPETTDDALRVFTI